jgi:TolB protein
MPPLFAERHMRAVLGLLAIAAGLAAAKVAWSQDSSNGLPAVSPDGRRIAFVGKRDGQEHLFVAEASGRNEHAVSLPSFDGAAPHWNAAGELLVAGARADSGKILAIPPGGGAPRIVADVPGRAPRLSPDGRRVLYLLGPWTSTAIAVAGPDGSNARVIAGGGATAWNGAWSPDGAAIAYTYGDSSRRLQVHIVNSDGSGDRAVTHTTPEEGSAQMPAWSPDGRYLAIQVNNHRDHSSAIWVVDLSSGKARVISPAGASALDETPSWFPDGTRVAFQSNRTGSMQVWIMNADGSNPRQVTGRPDSPGR